MKIAAADSARSALDELLVGPTAIAFGQDEAATAKAVVDTLRPYKQVRITGALLGDRAIDAANVSKLARSRVARSCWRRRSAPSRRRLPRPRV
jgi:ribosomal protein L10